MHFSFAAGRYCGKPKWGIKHEISHTKVSIFTTLLITPGGAAYKCSTDIRRPKLLKERRKLVMISIRGMPYRPNSVIKLRLKLQEAQNEIKHDASGLKPRLHSQAGIDCVVRKQLDAKGRFTSRKKAGVDDQSVILRLSKRLRAGFFDSRRNRRRIKSATRQLTQDQCNGHYRRYGPHYGELLRRGCP